MFSSSAGTVIACGCAQVVQRLFIALGLCASCWRFVYAAVVQAAWCSSFSNGGFAAEAGVDAAAVVEVFDPGGDPGVDLVACGEGIAVVALGFEGRL